jgi:uncharacterized membrane protein YfcA
MDEGIVTPAARPCGLRVMASLAWVLGGFGVVVGLWMLLGNETDLVQETWNITADQATLVGWVVLLVGAIFALLAFSIQQGWDWAMWALAVMWVIYLIAAIWYAVTQDGTDRLNAMLHIFLALLGLYWTVGDRAREYFATN